MENGDKERPEMGRHNKHSKKGESPTFEFFMFLVIFGWAGPLPLYFGVIQGNAGLIIVGLFFTWFFWGLLGGVKVFKDFIRYIT
jgi:hypothetical protein